MSDKLYERGIIKGLEKLNKLTAIELQHNHIYTISDIEIFDAGGELPYCEAKYWDEIYRIGSKHILHINNALEEIGHEKLKRVSPNYERELIKIKINGSVLYKKGYASGYRQGREDSFKEIIEYINSIYGTRIGLGNGTYIEDDDLLIKKMVINKLGQLKEQVRICNVTEDVVKNATSEKEQKND